MQAQQTTHVVATEFAAISGLSKGHEEEAKGEGLRQLYATMQESLPTASLRERASLHHRMGYISLLLADSRTKAIAEFTAARDLAGQNGDRELEGLAWYGLSVAYDHVGRRHEALMCAKEALADAEELDDHLLLGLALSAEAQFHKENGDNQRAYRLYRRILEIGTALENQALVMAAHIGLGRTTPMFELANAIKHYEDAIALAKAAGRPAAMALAYNNLADWLIDAGRLDEAIEMRERCVEIARKQCLRSLEGRALLGQAKARTLQGNFSEARRLLDMGYPKVVSSGDLEGDLHGALNLAFLYARSGDIPRATDLYRQILERSLAAPDHACAVFAQEALDLLSEGEIPAPGIVAIEPLTNDVLEAWRAEAAQSKSTGLRVKSRVHGGGVYRTGDMNWSGAY